MKKFKKGVVIRRLRKLFAVLIKSRDKVCVRCGRKDGSLQTYHIFPKGRYPSMQFLPENATLFCYQCHFQWWHKSPIDAQAWIKEYLGSKYNWLVVRSQLSETINESWLKEVEVKLKEALDGKT